MAVVEYILHQPLKYDPTVRESVFNFCIDPKLKPINEFPQIFLDNSEPWLEANRYAFSRFYDSKKSIKTVTREAIHLASYADWLEKNNTHWLHFPKVKRNRCLYGFRGYLIESRDDGYLAPSTASQIISAVLRFYRWAWDEGLIESAVELWEEKNSKLKFFDQLGFERSIDRKTSDLAINNRKRGPMGVEDGLFPLTVEQAKLIMAHLESHSTRELYLLHKVALLTGSRFETVTTLNIDVLRSAYRVANARSIYHVNVGPGTNVQTKFDVSGSIAFPDFLLHELIAHYETVQSILRRSKSSNKYHKTIFLTNRGRPYTLQSFSTLMKRLRDELAEKGHTEFKRFKFHQLRATHGTMLMKSVLAIDGISRANAIEHVKNALLQRDTRTAWKYIKFIEEQPVLAKFHEQLWQLFTNEKSNSEQLIKSITDRYDG